MLIYDMRTEGLTKPLGIDTDRARLTWKLSSDRRGAAQISYKTELSKKPDFSQIIWSETAESADNFTYFENPEPRTRYYWRVSVTDECGLTHTSGTEWFETGLGGGFRAGAEWIGAPYEGTNTDVLDNYGIHAVLSAEANVKTGIVIAARNKDNYTVIEIDLKRSLIIMKEYTDNAWDSGEREVISLGGFAFPRKIADSGKLEVDIRVKKRTVTLTMNGAEIIRGREVIPENPPNRPRKAYCMLFGLQQYSGKVVYESIRITDYSRGEPVVLQDDSFKNDYGALSALGEVELEGLVVENRFELMNPVPSVNLRKGFILRGEIESARLYASARGFYEAYINGEKIGSSYYNPGFTDFRTRIEYQTYDVTDFLRKGKNTIGALVSKSHYSGFCGYCGAMNYGRECSFIAYLCVRYTDGTEDSLVTDGTWGFTDKGSVINSDYFDGEMYDTRISVDWDDADRWRSCGVKAPDKGAQLTSRTDGGARLEMVLPAVAVTESPKGHFVYDFGQNMVGTVRLRMNGTRGKSIKIRYAEICRRDGSVYLENLRTAANTDVYTMAGGEEVFSPELTAHGFRYIEITGNGFALENSDFITLAEGLVINNTNGITGSFECSDALVNRLQSNILWGGRGNSLLVFTDCPQRNERMGWTGDIAAFAATGVYNTDICAFGKKWLRDLRDSQKMYNKNGAVPDTAPLGGDNRADGCSGWGDACVIVPWEMYKAYGDVRFLEENYEMMRDWLEYQNRPERRNYGIRKIRGEEVPEKSDLAREPYIQIQQRRGDHLAWDSSTPFILSATAYTAHSCDIMSKIAEILGKDGDANLYRERFEKIKQAFNDAWVEPDGSLAYWGEMSLDRYTRTSSGNLGANRDGSSINETYYSESGHYHASQTAYALAVAFDLVPPEKRARTYECLKRSIVTNNMRLSVGFLGTTYLAPALTKAGFTDTAYALFRQEGNPGWLYSVKNGATTVWERWDSYIAGTDTFGSPLMNSFNHYAYGAVGEWMYKTVLGINSGDGYENIIFRPSVGGGMTYARGELESPRGLVRSAWRLWGDGAEYTFTVPVGSRATVYLPKKADGGSGAEFIGKTEKGAMYALTSGEYKFIIKG